MYWLVENLSFCLRSSRQLQGLANLQVLQITLQSRLTGSGLHTLQIQDLGPCCRLVPACKALIIKNAFAVIVCSFSAGWTRLLLGQGSLTCSSAKRPWAIPVMKQWCSWHTQAHEPVSSTHTIRAAHPDCLPVHHLCKLDLMNAGELRWKTTPSCRCPLWLGLFIAFILDRWTFNPLDCL